MMRNIGYTVLILVILLGAWMFYTGAGTGEEESEVSLRQEVSREFAPDSARVTLGVETESKEAEKATVENNEKMENIVSEIEELEELEYSTANFHVDSRTRSEGDEEITYFNVTNQIEVETENPGDLGRVIQQGINAGANRVISINYLLADEKEAKKELTAAALDRLEEKINNIADEVGKEKVILDSLEVEDTYRTATKGDTFSLNAESEEDVGEPSLSPEDVEVSVNIQAVYKLR